MFTARCEYRLLLRADNADLRLTAKASKHGIVCKERIEKYNQKRASIDKARQTLGNIKLLPNEWEQRIPSLVLSQDGKRRSALELLGYNTVTLETLLPALPDPVRGLFPVEGTDFNAANAFSSDVLSQLEVEANYLPVIKKQISEVRQMRFDHALPVDPALDFAQVPSLSNEEREKLNINKPRSIGDAARIPGLTPAGLQALITYVKKQKPAKTQSAEN